MLQLISQIEVPCLVTLLVCPFDLAPYHLTIPAYQTRPARPPLEREVRYEASQSQYKQRARASRAKPKVLVVERTSLLTDSMTGWLADWRNRKF